MAQVANAMVVDILLYKIQVREHPFHDPNPLNHLFLLGGKWTYKNHLFEIDFEEFDDKWDVDVWEDDMLWARFAYPKIGYKMGFQ